MNSSEFSGNKFYKCVQFLLLFQHSESLLFISRLKRTLPIALQKDLDHLSNGMRLNYGNLLKYIKYIAWTPAIVMDSCWKFDEIRGFWTRICRIWIILGWIDDWVVFYILYIVVHFSTHYPLLITHFNEPAINEHVILMRQRTELPASVRTNSNQTAHRPKSLKLLKSPKLQKYLHTHFLNKYFKCRRCFEFQSNK